MSIKNLKISVLGRMIICWKFWRNYRLVPQKGRRTPKVCPELPRPHPNIACVGKYCSQMLDTYIAAIGKEGVKVRPDSEKAAIQGFTELHTLLKVQQSHPEARLVDSSAAQYHRMVMVSCASLKQSSKNNIIFLKNILEKINTNPHQKNKNIFMVHNASLQPEQSRDKTMPCERLLVTGPVERCWCGVCEWRIIGSRAWNLLV